MNYNSEYNATNNYLDINHNERQSCHYNFNWIRQNLKGEHPKLYLYENPIKFHYKVFTISKLYTHKFFILVRKKNFPDQKLFDHIGLKKSYTLTDIYYFHILNVLQKQLSHFDKL